MTTQRERDHLAPFANVYPESSGGRVRRVASIGRQNLLAWYERFKHYTHPDTFGDCGCGFAFSVAYEMTHGDQRTVDRLTGYDYDVKRAIELLAEPTPITSNSRTIDGRRS